MKKEDLFGAAGDLAEKSKTATGWKKVVYVALAILVAAAAVFFGTASCSPPRSLRAGYDKESGVIGVVWRPVKINYSKK